jgi:N-acetyl-anhydromuramoyl-L-alanine amidase
MHPSGHENAWVDGWLVSADRVDSPNFGSRPEQNSIDLVVLHSISLPPGQYGGVHVQELFTNRLDWDAHPYFRQMRGVEVSAHFYIQRGGQLFQFVSCDMRAWHAGKSSFNGRANCNDYSIGIELEGLEGGGFEGAQYRQLTSLLHGIRQQYPIKYVVGHEHIAPGRKTDPGSGFDWVRLRHSVAWPLQCFPALSNS